MNERTNQETNAGRHIVKCLIQDPGPELLSQDTQFLILMLETIISLIHWGAYYFLKLYWFYVISLKIL